eukprot:TRINITY_DN35016_c0_g1_i1.p1 TRINITY_DN35016_c0_g1~~TRINITY_DN35016_c0_g1_i1.p1  ORF type:complete len:252 (-),score=45.88 TRINITY_DN35016_c0_g1_i1:96-851(-)
MAAWGSTNILGQRETIRQSRRSFCVAVRSTFDNNGLPPLASTPTALSLDHSSDTPSSATSSSSWGDQTMAGRQMSRPGSVSSGSSMGRRGRAYDQLAVFFQEPEHCCKAESLAMEDSQVRGCKRELRRKANLAKLDADASQNLRRWKTEQPASWRGAQPLFPSGRRLKQELRHLKDSIHRSHDDLCRADPATVADFVDASTCSPSFKAKLTRVVSQPAGYPPGPVGEVFATEEGQRFVNRFRQFRENECTS